MKRIYILTIVTLLCGLSAQAQIKPDDPVEKKMAYARFLLNNKINTQLHQKAFDIVRGCAADGYAPAMNALGILYKDGIGTEENKKKAFFWIKKSGECGYPKGYYNLHLLYRFGIGVEQDFDMAQEYLQKAADMNNIKSYYGLGYNAYKGLGCEQNYEKAVQYFTYAAERGEPSSMYMLGICYKNGYGVTRNTGEAAFWLEKAARKRSGSAKNELNVEEPENPIIPVMLPRLASHAENNDIKQFRSVKHRKETDLSGEYNGMLITYDWSGKHVIKENNITLNIEQSGDNLSIRWEEEGADTLQIEALQTDTALVFSEAVYKKANREIQGNKTLMKFSQATVSSLQNGEELQLYGNLRFFLPELREPGQPMYITVSRKQETSESEKNAIDTWAVYPTPFTDRCNISFTLTRESECRIAIYDRQGKEIYAENLGTVPAGHHNYALDTDLVSGIYILKFFSEERIYTQQIIRK